MSKLADFVRAEAEYKRLKEQMEAMQNDDSFKKELEFKDKLEALMKKYEKSEKDVLEILDPAPAKEEEKSSGNARRKRKLKVYKNPHTGEVVESRGGNHKVLKHWKAEHGNDEVESWLAEERD
ncbi:histone-like nucleoid-structuring protein, MvaT/MvaU family [Salinicola aestuarinus]|uniref:histone-like nucleoid-structuring protein, MvaT/MvaU family n=1 Tax=Salinicola aestuarinus TaxID=1949082 RepID=UPI000DA20204|nr:histone-like nucleoid-structuring protein, MvaT/MvaU family [Salinicola aestuarinus]